MYWKFALIFGIFLIVDIAGHLGFRIKRKLAEWILMSLMVVLTIGSVTMGTVKHFNKDKGDASELFMAYKYLVDGDVSRAQAKLAVVGGEYATKASVMDAMVSIMEKDYIQGYFKTERLLDSGILNGTDKKYVKEIQNICMKEIGLGEDNIVGSNKTEDDNADDSNNNIGSNIGINADNNADNDADSDTDNQSNSYQEYLQELIDSQVTYTGSNVSTEDNDDENEAKDLVDSYIDEMDFSEKEEEKYTQDYEMDSTLYGEDISQVTEGDISDIENEYGETEDVLRLKCKYYVNLGDYENAKKIAAKLIDKYRNEENYVIYTDIIAQEAYTKEQLISEGGISVDKDTDSEVKDLIEEANDKMEEARVLQDKYGEDSEEMLEKIDKLISDANDLYKEANYVDVKRAINYIIAKKPASGDDTGIYDLQLAKLYLIIGDRESANKYLHTVIDNSVDISDSSSIKEAVDEVVTQYNQISDDSYNAELNSAIDGLIKAQSNGVVPATESTVNGSFDSYVTNTLKYDKIQIHISRIDKSNYPTLRAYVNINGDKDGKSELASEFTEEDFDLIDTMYKINNFKILKDEGYNQVSLAIVMDKSGSMEGSAIDNAKSAATEAANYMEDEGEKIAIITYDDSATTSQGLTASKERLKRAISSIAANGGTNIAGGLIEGIDTIKDEKGSRAIILMSDGQDGNAGQMPEAIEYAIDEGIAVYTVGFGEVDDDYMSDIAEQTGGKYMKASDSSELADIYLTLQKYIVNNYCIEYTVEKNVDTDPRNLTVNVSKYNTSDNMDYYIKEENKPEGDETTEGIEKIDENTLGISSITPSTASIQNVADGVKVTITGGGFEDKMNVSIGNLVLSDVKVISKTELTGTLKGTMETGRYDIQIKTSDGKLTIGNKMFYVFKAGTTQSIRLGCTTITADVIGQMADDKLVASGNVMINGFVHSAGEMEITVEGMNPDIDLTANSSVYVGEEGKLEGHSKLYISYSQMENANGFAAIAMGGKDYVIQKSTYAVDVDAQTTSFDSTICDFDLSIPLIMDIDVAEVNLYSNRLQIDIKSVRLDEIIKNVNDSLKHKKGTNEPDPTPQPRSSANKFDFKDPGDLALSMALTPDGMQFGGEVTVNVNDALKFGTFGINEIGLKLNSLDADNEYWKISGKLDFSHIMPGFGGSGVEGIDGSLSSYYWLPDKVVLDATLNPGIPVYEIIEINEVGGSIQGMSTGILRLYENIVSPETYKIIGTNINSDAYNYQDVILSGTLGAEANIFNVVKLDNKLFKKFKEWGEIGTIDGTVEVNFSEPEFKVGAEMSLLGSEKAKAEAKINKDGLDITAGIELNISGFGLDVNAGADVNLGGNLTGAYEKMTLKGNLDCSPLKIHVKGESSVKIEWEWDFDTAAVTVNYKDGGVDKEGSLFYDADGGFFIWDKITVEMP